MISSEWMTRELEAESAVAEPRLEQTAELAGKQVCGSVGVAELEDTNGVLLGPGLLPGLQHGQLAEEGVKSTRIEERCSQALGKRCLHGLGRGGSSIDAHQWRGAASTNGMRVGSAVRQVRSSTESRWRMRQFAGARLASLRPNPLDCRLRWSGYAGEDQQERYEDACRPADAGEQVGSVQEDRWRVLDGACDGLSPYGLGRVGTSGFGRIGGIDFPAADGLGRA